MNTEAEDKCSACGKTGDGLKTCTACKMATYCNITCQKSHRPKHKKECKNRAAELYDELLFKQPTMEDCPICFLPISIGVTDAKYQTCCGKTVCAGCLFAVRKERMIQERELSYLSSQQNKATLPPLCCPFCREQQDVSSDERYKRVKHRIEMNDADAVVLMGWAYHNGDYGLTPDRTKAFQLWLKAADLGSIEANNNVALAYMEGRGVQVDQKKSVSYWEKAAIGGDSNSRYNLYAYEMNECRNMRRGTRHLMIAASAGLDHSLTTMGELFRMRQVSKQDYETTLRAHKAAVDETKSEQRDQAAAITSQVPSQTPPVRYV